ncbi:MAG: hypothetical protein AAF636_20675 [Pseudomonadota bacterium]
MIRFQQVLLAGVFSFVTAVSAQAGGFIYDCTIPDADEYHFIAPKVAIIVEQNGTASVLDTLALRRGGTPFPAQISRNTEQKMVVRWVVKDTTDSDNQSAARMNFEAMINKKTGKIRMFARTPGFSNTLTNSGLCQVVTG